MHRRSLLKGVVTLPLLSAVPRSLLATADARALTLNRLRPANAGWPSAASWQKLKDAVGGNLIEVQPLFHACESDPDGAACLDATKNIHNPFYIGDQPAGTQVSGWLDAWTCAPSVYAIRARGTADVVAAVNFARTNNLRLVIKGGGHSYQGTSNAADSLLVWMRAMNKVTLHDSFAAPGCEGTSAPVPAVSAEAGAMWIDLYDAVTTQAGRYVQGGGCTTVGVAGLVQSGGFGSISKAFGTAAAGLLQAEVVTADGAVLTVNACDHPDLFWAIKGGGGGSWGVITKLTLRTHELPELFGAAWGKIQAHSDEGFRKLIAHFVGFYADNLFNAHWGEQVSISPQNTLKISMVSQGLDKPQAQRAWQPFFDWVKGLPQEFLVTAALGTDVTAARHWWDIEGNNSMVRDTRAGAARTHAWWQGDSDQVGAYLHGYDSLWLPASLLQVAHQRRLADALYASSRYKSVGLHFNKGLAGAPAEVIASARKTATNPAVADAFALAIIADGEAPAYPGLPRPAMDLEAARKDAHDVDLATAELRKIVPKAGSYVSESNYFNASWQEAFWGENYPRLRAVKTKYDPGGLFFVHHGVGSEDWSADGFTPTAK
jgi:FAD/FMN-containing dehydrogenase